MDLTNDATKMICLIYKSYLELRKSGNPKAIARRFSEFYFSSHKTFSTWHPDDIRDTFLELARKGLLKIYIGGNFDLTDAAIIYMENRFKNGLTEITDFISKFLPW